MRVSVVRPGDLGPSEAALWAGFQESSPEIQSPFLSLTFAQVVGRSRPNARVAVVEDDEGIAAFLAFELAPHRIGMPIGYPMNNLQAFVARGTPLDARQVVRKAGLRGWRFVAAPAQQQALAPHHYEGTAVQAPLIDLSNGYKPYHLSRSRNLLDTTKRRLRSLERQVGPVSLEWGTSAPEHVRQLIDWKCAKYGGARELFSGPTARRIVEECATTSSEDCGGLVKVLRAGERPVAVLLSLTCPNGLSEWFSAYDNEMSRFSPGTVLDLSIAEEAARRDITRIDMGAGQDRYKFRLANASYPVAGGAVWASRWEQAARGIYRRFRADDAGPR
jgi:CelD/BcsL family acetyltransferase involved in cellulose biosynthesis